MAKSTSRKKPSSARSSAVKPWQRLYYYFLFSGLLGYVYENLLDPLWYHHPWQWQGPLHGPWLIIYACGGVALLVLLEGLVKKKLKVGKVNVMPLVVAMLIFLIAGVVEYAGHWLLDTFFDFRPWDYSAKPFNINGRVCLEDTLRFVVLGMFGMYVCMPWIDRFLNWIPKWLNTILCVFLVGAFAFDVVYSFGILLW